MDTLAEITLAVLSFLVLGCFVEWIAKRMFLPHKPLDFPEYNPYTYGSQQNNNGVNGHTPRLHQPRTKDKARG